MTFVSDLFITEWGWGVCSTPQVANQCTQVSQDEGDNKYLVVFLQLYIPAEDWLFSWTQRGQGRRWGEAQDMASQSWAFPSCLGGLVLAH